MWKLIGIILISECFLFVSSIDEEEIKSSITNQRLLNVMRVRRQACEVQHLMNASNLQGVCLPKAQCVVIGGIYYLGPCHGLGVCCAVSRSCLGSTASQISYFVSPTFLKSVCEFHVDIYSREVVQLRLDFEEFNLEPPTQSILPFGPFECRDQYLEINTGTIPSINIPLFCGNNKGQHIYIPISTTTSAVILGIKTDTSKIISPGKWRIKISQLEPQNASTSADVPFQMNPLPSSIYNSISKMAMPIDYPPLAPSGCLQFYTLKNGNFESFNFKNKHYIANLDYAICFHRESDDCGIRFSADLGDFQIGSNPIPPTSSCYDHLFIRSGQKTTSNNFLENEWCGIFFDTITSHAPGPFYVIFKSDSNSLLATNEIGFRINYEILNECTSDEDLK